MTHDVINEGPMPQILTPTSLFSTGLRPHSTFPISGVPLAVNRPHRHHLHDGGHRPREVLGRLRTIEDGPDHF